MPTISIIVAAMFSILATTTVVQAQTWQKWEKNTKADWDDKDSDVGCTGGAEPQPSLCNATTRNFVAVCGSSHPNCAPDDPNERCRYKILDPNTQEADGKAPGTVYVCR
jgi:hypothetical protein